jgi:DNA-binding MarR family transcriptional regulator
MAAIATNTARSANGPLADGIADGLKGRYLETVQLMERLHKQFLELVQAELGTGESGDINSVQAMIVHAIGAEEVLVGDVIQRGYYLGTNVSYNVRKLVEAGYLTQERSRHDRRALKLRLTPKGLELCERLDRLFETHIRELEGSAMFDELAHATRVLKDLSSFWARFGTA